MPESKRPQITELFHKAVMLAPGEQSAFLDQACSSDHELYRRVKDLLDAYAEIRTTDSASLEPERLDARLDTGTLIALGGRYNDIAVIGHGGMGVVLRAYDCEIGKVAALKILPASLTRDDRAIARFRNEIRIALEITHKNICRTYSLENFQGRLVISMEYIAGETLRTILDRAKGVSVPQGISWAKEICEALTAAHERKVVHRDLKPENIMIDHDGHVKVMDFGIARSIDGTEHATGTIAGTPRYMSPEQAMGRALAPSSDIYSLGLVLYELFTGVLPDQKSPMPPSETIPGLPARIDSAIRKCLLADPHERFQSAREVALALTGDEAKPRHHRVRYVVLTATSALGMLAIGLTVNHWRPLAGLARSSRAAPTKSASILPTQTTSEQPTSTKRGEGSRNFNSTPTNGVLPNPPQHKSGEATIAVQGTWFVRVSGVKGARFFNANLSQTPGGDVVGTLLPPVPGDLKGKVVGNLLTFHVTLSIPNCPGAIQGSVRISANRGSGTYAGSDCSGDHGQETISMSKWSPAALSEHDVMRRMTIGDYLLTKLLIWTEEDAQTTMGEELLHRYGYDEGHTVESDIFTFADPTVSADRIELAFDVKTKRLTNIYLYPIGRQTEEDVRKVAGDNFTLKENPDGSEFLLYNDRALNVLLDKDGNVVNLGLYRRF
jgi:serine/threonine protein kinase